MLDAILEAFEGHLEEYAFFLPLLEDYPCEKSTFVNILGLKFQCYQVCDSLLPEPPFHVIVTSLSPMLDAL